MDAVMIENFRREGLRKRKRRYVFTNHQLHGLEENFVKYDGYLLWETAMNLTEKLDLSYHRINLWFQSRRARFRNGYKKFSFISTTDFNPSLLKVNGHPCHTDTNKFANCHSHTPFSLDPQQTRALDFTDKEISGNVLRNQREELKLVLSKPKLSGQKDGVEISDNTKPSATIHYSERRKPVTSEEIHCEGNSDQSSHKHQEIKRRLSAPVKKNKTDSVEKRPLKRRRRTHGSLSLPFAPPRLSLQESDPHTICGSVSQTISQLPSILSKVAPLMSTTTSNAREPSIYPYDVSLSILSNADSNLPSVMSNISPTQIDEHIVSSISSDIPFQPMMCATASNPEPLLSSTAFYHHNIRREAPSTSSHPRFRSWLLLPAPIVAGAESVRSETGMLLTDSNQATRLADQKHESYTRSASSKQAHLLGMSCIHSNLQQNSYIQNSVKEEMPHLSRDSEHDKVMAMKLPTIPYKPAENNSGSPKEDQCDLSQVCSLSDRLSWHSPAVNLYDSTRAVTRVTSPENIIPDVEQPLDLRIKNKNKDRDQQYEHSLDQVVIAKYPVTVSNICNNISTSSRNCTNLPDDVIVMYSSYRDHLEVESCDDNVNDNDGSYDETSDNAADTGTDYQTKADEKCIRILWNY